MNDVEEDPIDYKSSQNFREADVTKVKKLDFSQRPVLTTVDRNTYDDSFFHYLYVSRS